MTRNEPPRDTDRAMREDPAEQLLLLAAGATPGTRSAFIEAQEAAGQRELVASATIPTRLTVGTEADLVAFGFTLGQPCPCDPMFREVTLPDGWTRQASDHAMWSYIVDELGRRRVAMFYKAAFYDRNAYTQVVTLPAYVRHCLDSDEFPVLDETWASAEAVLAALDGITAEQLRSAAELEDISPRYAATLRQSAEQAQRMRERIEAGR